MNSVVFENRWNAATGEADAAEMRSLARDIGFALPNRDGASLRRFLSTFGPTAGLTENAFARAFRRTAVEIVASYETAVAALEAERSAESLVVHEGWHRILSELAERTVGPTDLASTLQLSKSHLSRALSAMRGADLVEVTPSTSGRERPHRLTGLGDRLLQKLNQEQPEAGGAARTAEQSEIAELAARSLTSLSFKTAREITFYVALIYLAVEAIPSGGRSQSFDLGTLREIRRLLIDIPSGVYVPTNFTPQGQTQEVLALLRARLTDTEFSTAYQQSLAALGRQLRARSTSTALAWACVAADFAEAFRHIHAFDPSLSTLTVDVLAQYRTPLALWCRAKAKTVTDLPGLVQEMRFADVTAGFAGAPQGLVDQLEKTRNADLFFSDPNAHSLPLSDDPRLDLAKQLLMSAERIQAVSLAGSDDWLSNSEYFEANCQAAERGKSVERLIVFDDDAQIRAQKPTLDVLCARGVRIRRLKREVAQRCWAPLALDNILIWNEQVMTTSRARGKAIFDSLQINTAVEAWRRAWVRARQSNHPPPDYSSSDGAQPAE